MGGLGRTPAAALYQRNRAYLASSSATRHVRTPQTHRKCPTTPLASRASDRKCATIFRISTRHVGPRKLLWAGRGGIGTGFQPALHWLASLRICGDDRRGNHRSRVCLTAHLSRCFVFVPIEPGHRGDSPKSTTSPLRSRADRQSPRHDYRFWLWKPFSWTARPQAGPDRCSGPIGPVAICGSLTYASGTVRPIVCTCNLKDSLDVAITRFDTYKVSVRE